MSFTPPPALSPFAQHLVSAGLLVEAQARELADQARAEEMSFGLYLENKKWVNAASLAEATAHFFALPLYDLDVHQSDKMPIEFMSLDVVQKGLAIPLLRKKNTLMLGIADPEPINVSEIAFATGAQIKLIVVEADKLRALTADMREAQMVAGLENIGESALANLDISAYEEPTETLLSIYLEDKPIVSYVN